LCALTVLMRENEDVKVELHTSICPVDETLSPVCVAPGRGESSRAPCPEISHCLTRIAGLGIVR
jgi:hypothetical protein